MPLNQMMVLVTLAESFAFALVALVMFQKKKTKLAQSYRTWAEVREIRAGQGNRPALRHVLVQYIAANGEKKELETTFSQNRSSLKTGDRLEIFVPRENPELTEVAGFGRQWAGAMVFGALSLSSLLMAPLLYFILRR